ncbi:GNAT family N-acetyltransferase [Catenuloplanes atrovinosus]|uniref:Acetyltransferase n=1 Tax=Catenuloplanes atrovinosus TaxID=137266 RepID=A0AAE3YU97_9ACTN|nr:GNAT family N-acetyltransferase [Catenuloplanes atrovinosus]MDR7278740.1 putative acetyltransferase [Catenuloplanes atrovinosus]
MSPILPDLTVRPGTEADLDAILQLIFASFHDPPDPALEAAQRAVCEPERSVVATDGELLAGHLGSFGRELTVPGGIVPAAHVTQVGVAPTHRRRGVLTALMRRHLTDAPEPVAALWASEGRIYPRYGYGLAAPHLTITAATREVRLPDGVPGRLRVGTPTALRAVLTEIYEAVRPHRPGWSSRPSAWWDYRHDDSAASRGGGTALRVVVREGPDGPDGYALWRVVDGDNPANPRISATLAVKEFVAASPAAYLDLWRFLFGIDLTARVTYHHAALDEPLLYLADDPGWLGTRWEHGLWIRLRDVPAALSARRYATPVDVVLELTDALLPANAGRWHLRGDLDGASCEHTSAPAALALDVRDLGAAYLGGTPLSALAGAGLIDERVPGAVAATSAALGWHRAPSMIETF